MIPLIVFGAVVAAIVVWLAGMYNGLVRLRNHVKNAWAQIDVQLKRRHDLIPNLVETVKGYAGHEKETLENVTRARGAAVSAGGGGAAAQAQAESALSGALGRLMLVVEKYPDLKANQNFLALQEELTSTENKIGFSRQLYNDSVMIYNTRTQTVPTNIIAGMFSFKEEEFFELEDEAARQAPQVKF
ncbi:MAG: LemA family protein [Acidobacteria bacterium]|nr:MAG: LemA family protein [Acidobacteriota bacterium]